MIATSQPLAAQAGLEILNAGGNAADAAVATAAALNVTEPSCTGIGGDIFCLYYDKASKSVGGINGSGRAPKALTLEHLRSQGVTGETVSEDVEEGLMQDPTYESQLGHCTWCCCWMVQDYRDIWVRQAQYGSDSCSGYQDGQGGYSRTRAKCLGMGEEREAYPGR